MTDTTKELEKELIDSGRVILTSMRGVSVRVMLLDKVVEVLLAERQKSKKLEEELTECGLRTDEFADPEFDDEEVFQFCSECDGHNACMDFGCAIKLGFGHMIEVFK